MLAWPRYLGILLLWQISCGLMISQLRATDVACPVEYWLISTRHLGCNNHADRSSELRYWQYQTATKSWESKTVTDWQSAAATPTPTWFMVHGNRANHQDSINYGWNFSQQLLRYGTPSGSLRIVIWSWPSDQIHGALDDVRSKAARTPTESILLAQLISQLPSETPSPLSDIVLAQESQREHCICWDEVHCRAMYSHPKVLSPPRCQPRYLPRRYIPLGYYLAQSMATH